MIRPLLNRRFLITRPENQSDRLASLLVDAGAIPLLAPMIAIGETDDPARLQATLERLTDFDLAVFVSPTALDEVGKRIDRWPEGLTAAVIGPASRDRAAELGMTDVLCPEGRYDSEGLLAHPELQQLSGRKVVLFRGNGGRELLADTLAARGATVEIVESYRRLPPTMARDAVAQLLLPDCDGVIVTSSEAVQNLFALCDDVLAAKLKACLFFASHATIADTARRFGVASVFLTATGDAGIVASIRECFAGSQAAAIPEPDTTQGSAVQKVAASRSTAPRHRVLNVWLGRIVWVGVGITGALGVNALVANYRPVDPHGDMGNRIAQLEAHLQAMSAGVQRDGAHVGEIDNKIASTNQQLTEVQAQQADLQGLYGSIAGDQEETLLADAELTLSLASQQLQLTGNVGAALAALYRLDERLAGHDKPRLMPLRRSLARDLDALKRVPWVDYVGLSARIDSMASAIDSLPLVVDAKATDETPAATVDQRTGLLGEIGRSLGALVEIRRIDQPDPVLLAPRQALYLREQVKLRLLNARLALLQRDEVTFKRDLAATEQTLRKHFDGHAKSVIATLTTLRDLQSARPAQALPGLVDSLNAARDARRKASKEDNK